MNTPKAIKVLQQERSDHHSFPTDIIGQAEQLGIEALEWFNKWRGVNSTLANVRLPTETED